MVTVNGFLRFSLAAITGATAFAAIGLNSARADDGGLQELYQETARNILACTENRSDCNGGMRAVVKNNVYHVSLAGDGLTVIIDKKNNRVDFKASASSNETPQVEDIKVMAGDQVETREARIIRLKEEKAERDQFRDGLANAIRAELRSNQSNRNAALN